MTPDVGIQAKAAYLTAETLMTPDVGIKAKTAYLTAETLITPDVGMMTGSLPITVFSGTKESAAELLYFSLKLNSWSTSVTTCVLF